MSRPIIFCTRRLPQDPREILGDAFELRTHGADRPITRAELLDAVKGVSGLLCLLSDRIDRELFEAAGPSLKVVANFAVGYNNIDVAEAARRSVTVTNTPDVLSEATADLAWALLFAASRRVIEGDRMMREGRFHGWEPEMLLGQDITGATLGIIGSGRIGTAMASKARAFRMRVLYTGSKKRPEFEAATGGTFVGLEELLSQCDFLSLHCPLSPATTHLIDEAALARMKPTAVLINTARGPVVDEEALVRSLKAGRIAAAGLDVYEREPAMAAGLSELPNVVLLPHLGSATLGTRRKMVQLAASNIRAVLEGRAPATPVHA